jgi:hypothetical protein
MSYIVKNKVLPFLAATLLFFWSSFQPSFVLFEIMVRMLPMPVSFTIAPKLAFHSVVGLGAT